MEDKTITLKQFLLDVDLISPVNIDHGHLQGEFMPAECSLYTGETHNASSENSWNVICDEYRNRPSVCIPHFYNVRESGEFTHVILENCHRVDGLSEFRQISSI